MSATLIPPTKPFAGRPPVVPPTWTTFDGMGDDNREPMFRILAARVERTLKAVATWPDDDLSLLMRLLEHFARVVEQELNVERMFESQQLPPTSFGSAFPMEYSPPQENEAIRTYLYLLSGLYDAILRVRKKMGLLKDLLPSSEG